MRGTEAVRPAGPSQLVSLRGARVLVVGASAGIGRAVAKEAIAQGADVCVSARRGDRLEALVAEAGAGHVIAADVTSAADRDRVVEAVARAVGELDYVLYAAGAAVLAPMNASTEDGWRLALDINVLAPSLLAVQLLDVVSHDGLMTFLTSDAVTAIRWGLASYAASKSALNTTVEYLRHEHRDRRFQRAVVGPTMPTEFGDRFDAEHLEVAFHHWAAAGIGDDVMATDDLARVLAETAAMMLAHPHLDIPELSLAPRGKPWA